jgi:ribonuclease III
VLGAIFLDGGFEASRRFICREFAGALGELSGIPILDNPKGELQEMLQAHSTDAPEYRVASVAGPDHDRVYECGVFHGGVELARGQGKSKKAAESEAALAALQKLKGRETPPGQITMSFSKPHKRKVAKTGSAQLSQNPSNS